MAWNIRTIRKALGIKLVGDLAVREMVCETLLLLPDEVIDYVTEKVWFFSTAEDSWAYSFHGNDLKDKHFIYLSDELFNQERMDIQYTILHEVGHIILKHKNAIDRRQTESEIKMQERQADRFAKNYLILSAL